MAARLTRLLMLLTVVVLAMPARAHAGAGDEPSASDEDRQRARRLAATFRRADGIERAFRTASRDEPADELPSNVAVAVLVERAAAAMPTLLTALAAGAALDPEQATERVLPIWARYEVAKRVVEAAVCRGAGDDAYDIGQRSDAAGGRVAAQRALIAALSTRGARRRGAIAALLELRRPDHEGADCGETSKQLVRRAGPALARILAAKDSEADVLGLFALGDADPRVAVAVIRPYLTDPKHVAVAALALARMGQDVSQAVGPLADRLDGREVDVALDALGAIGPRAREALPRLVALSRRLDATCRNPVEGDQLVATVAAIATRPDDASVALPMLSALLTGCPWPPRGTARAIAQLGKAGHALLLTYLRDDNRKHRERNAIAKALQASGVALDAADQDIVRLLAAREAARDVAPDASQVPTEPPPRDAFRELADKAAACRAEGGRQPVAATGLHAGQADKLAGCFDAYLCGPSPRTLVRTLERCCGEVLGAQRPAFCRP